MIAVPDVALATRIPFHHQSQTKSDTYQKVAGECPTQRFFAPAQKHNALENSASYQWPVGFQNTKAQIFVGNIQQSIALPDVYLLPPADALKCRSSFFPGCFESKFFR